ncbi:MAG: hypothetical protein SGILL_009172, partial [Bacillariaceae sp.]
SMLPKQVGNDSTHSKHADELIAKAMSADDFWSDAGVSTLGMRNDTFEYGLCGGNIKGPAEVLTQSYYTMDNMSLSSLNEILDGPMEEEEQERRPKSTKVGGASPRSALRSIDVPQRQPRKSRYGSAPPNKQKKILGLITPSAKGLKSLMTPRRNKHAAAAVEKKNPNKMGVMEVTMNGPTTTIIEEDEYNELSDVDSQGVVPDEDYDETARPDLVKENIPTLRSLKSESTDSNGGGEERYTPDAAGAKEKAGLKLVTTASFKEPDFEEIDDVKPEEVEEEWDDSVYQRNIDELKSKSKDPTGDNESEWDETVHPFLTTDSVSAKHIAEPVGKTPSRDHHDIEMSLSRLREEDGKLRITPSGDVTAVLDFDMGEDIQETPKDSKKTRNKKNPKSPSSAKSTKSAMSPSNKSEKSHSVRSEGSKTKIFGRIVDIMGHKRNPLVPTAVVEETYVVTESVKKAMGDGEPIVAETRRQSKLAKAKHHKHKHQKKSKKALDTIDEKHSGNVATKTNKKKSFGIGSNGTVFDDDTQVIEMAVSNGALKANQSNEDEDDAPPNYLAMMLRKKAKEERRKTKENTDAASTTSSQKEPEDADSYVAAIRGPRHQECPGVALEGVTNRKLNRDPDTTTTMDSGSASSKKETLRNNLLPTPRFQERSKSIEQLNDPATVDHDPPLNDERERQRDITARLFAAGSSDGDDGNTKKRTTKFQEVNVHKQHVVDPAQDDFLDTVPTVDSAASYEDEEPVEDAPGEASHDVELAAEDLISAVVVEDHGADHNKSRKGGGRKSFLPARLKLKI